MVKQLNYWIVIPSYNEEAYLERVLKKINRFSRQIIVVDDGSTDATARIAQQHTHHVLHHAINLGKGAALKTGCDYAFMQLRAEAVIMLDGDDQHDPAEITAFIQALETTDIVHGVRNLSHMPFVRRLGNYFISFIIYLLFGTWIPDVLSGYKALRKNIYNQLRWDSSGYQVELELAARLAHKKIKIATIPIKTIYHDFDRGMTFLDGVFFIGHLINWRITL